MLVCSDPCRPQKPKPVQLFSRCMASGTLCWGITSCGSPSLKTGWGHLAGNDNEFPNASRSDVEAGLEVLRRAGAPLLAHAEIVSHIDVQVRGGSTSSSGERVTGVRA